MRGDARATGKSCEVNPLLIDCEALARVVENGVGRLSLRRPRAVAGVVGGRDDVAVEFGGVLKLGESERAASEWVENVYDRPGTVVGIFCRKIKRLSLLRVGDGGYFGNGHAEGKCFASI